ncbi:MAG: DivIVA domain-containing protein [Actinomycetota bacterium]|nr:DivIVA domain-containing protein [Actinomycetota bacterium]
MAISFSRPDPSSPTAVSTANFAHARRGYEPEEVREFLRMVAAELARLQEREKFLERELRVAQRHGPTSAVALDEEVVTRMLGEEAARILSTAREAASQIKVRAEEGASRVLREATDEAQRLREEAEIESARRRQDAASDAESELQMAKQQGREMVNEARAYRERVLGELARRRELARQQIEQLVHGRDRLLQAFERARIAAVDVMAEMTPLGEPSEYVNLSPTTGPVPLMVPATDARPQPEVAEAEVESEVEAESDEAPAAELVDDADLEPALEELAAIEAEEAFGDEADEADEPLAPVVALFADDLDETDDETDDEIDETVDVDATVALGDESDGEPSKVDDLFARLRAARADTVVERTLADDATDMDATDLEATDTDTTDTDATDTDATADEAVDPDATVALHLVPPAGEMVIGEELSVFAASPVAPEVEDDTDDSPFGRRDAELTPLIVAGARKLKRVLADEQNDVLHILRRNESVRGLDVLLPTEAEHTLRYAAAVEGELRTAALAGAASVDSGDKGDHLHEINRGRALQPAIDALAATVVAPLRDRILRAVADADGDNGDLADAVRAIYREWKTQRIDEHLDDVARMAFGRGALVALTPGTPVCWTVDPNGPACPDAEDNALAGVIGAGEAFPTDHTCAPAHDGCRCMLQRASR